MQCSVVVLVALFAILVPNVRSAPQRSIDFLLGDEELQAVVKPVPGDSSLPVQQRQLALDQEEQDDEQQQREYPELKATVDPIENEQQTEDPSQGLTEEAVNEEQATEEPHGEKEEAVDTVTDRPKESVQTSTSTDDLTPPSASEATPSLPKVVTPLNGGPNPIDSEEDNSSEEQLTTNPIVVEDSKEQSTTESNEDSNQFAEDVNSLVDDSTNRVRFEAEDNPDQPPPNPQPKQKIPEYSKPLPPAPVVPVTEGYDSKSLESNEDDDQVQLKVDPNDEQRTDGPSLTEDQFRSLFKLPWLAQQRAPGYEQWQRSSWQQRDDRQRQYQPHSLDGFHGHGFHRGTWH